MKHLKTYEDYNYTEIFDEIDKFLSSNLRNTYVNDKNISIYVRKSKRFIDGNYYDFFDIANISIEEEYQNKHVFTDFIEKFISKYPFNIYVESILNPAVTTVLNKFGFKLLPGENINMYLIR